MRKIAYALALLALSAPVGVTLHAQDTPSTAATQPKFTPDQVLARYGKELSLTDDQKAKLKPIITDRQQGMLDLRADTSSRPRDKMKKMQSLKASTDARINAILTPDQQKKYAAMEAAQMEKMQERRKGAGAS